MKPIDLRAVADEVSRNRGIVAAVNERTGAVQMFVAPKPYWEKDDKTAKPAPVAVHVVDPATGTGRASSLTPTISEYRSDLRRAETDLRHAQASGVTGVELQRLEQAVIEAKAELDRAEAPRIQERRDQYYGGNAKPTRRIVAVQWTPVPDSALSADDLSALQRLRARFRQHAGNRAINFADAHRRVAAGARP